MKHNDAVIIGGVNGTAHLLLQLKEEIPSGFSPGSVLWRVINIRFCTLQNLSLFEDSANYS
jgi:hypothetical protein